MIFALTVCRRLVVCSILALVIGAVGCSDDSSDVSNSSKEASDAADSTTLDVADGEGRDVVDTSATDTTARDAPGLDTSERDGAEPDVSELDATEPDASESDASEDVSDPDVAGDASDVCEPDCGGKECGDDGCGGVCDTCESNETCDDGTCACVPDCDGKECGDDGCGGECGTCASDESCSDGQCDPTPTYSSDVWPILDANCGGTNCHGGASPAEGLDMSTASAAYNHLVGVAASQCANRLRVDAGDSASSYLVDKLEGSNLCNGSQMPAGAPLSQSDIDTIKLWIDDGAPNN